MNKTISEIAKDLSVSRQAIHQSLDDLLDKKKLKKRGNTYLLNPSQQRLIIEYFQKSSDEELSTNLSTNLITTLQSQNELLSKELDSKNKQINELHILLLKEKENNLLLISSEAVENDTPRKNKFWSRLFNQEK